MKAFLASNNLPTLLDIDEKQQIALIKTKVFNERNKVRSMLKNKLESMMESPCEK